MRVNFAAAGVVAIASCILTPAAAGAAASSATRPSHTVHRVLRVGKYHGVKGQYRTIQAAIDHARPGDWVLIGPGDYKTPHSHAPRGRTESPAGVLITTAKLNIRGMNRNHVIVDGTKSGPPCSTARKDQVLGPKTKSGHVGRNGVMVWKANNVRVDNLTTCNFLNGPAGDNGNEIWWNGGDDSGSLGGKGFWGDYLTTTSTYFHGEASAAQYGIFSSNWVTGWWNHTYASNFNDSGYYIGACRQVCNQYVDDAWAEYNALGYSGSNSGGTLVVKNSEFDHNEDGFDTNSQNGDNPPPQNGACPNGKTSPITHTHSCWVFMHNYVHDNNDPNVPTAGSAAAGPVGTGISISGGRNDTVMNNVFKNNKAWGAIFVPYPDSGPPCTGGTSAAGSCIYDESGDALLNNTFVNNGGFGNPTNGDFAAVNLEPGPTDCFRGNHEKGGAAATSSPAGAETTYPKCDGSTVPPDANSAFLDEVACDSGADIAAGVSGKTLCLPGDNYPRQTKVVMHRLPGAKRKGHRSAIENPASAHLKSMPHPCAGVPTNPWCPRTRPHDDSATPNTARAAAPGAGRVGPYARLSLWASTESRRRIS